MATSAAISAAEAYAERTGICVRSNEIPYCPCPSCIEEAAAEAAAETYAEGAWLRAAENAGEPCRGIWALDGGCACC